MKKTLFVGLLGLCCLPTLRGFADEPDEKKPDALDRSKLVAERPAKKLVSDLEALQQELQRQARAGEQSHVEKVAPGKVKWHADRDQAQAAARRSGKPVMLFQLLGQLDEHFT
ncbi:MAG: hypothetical protein QF918_10240 [Pirellulaceae bacterium]|jgi:alkylated DNA repair dioxygenase AlkB|nr:hypothetical protein [Blastopirellula sp.]MDP6468109.1 hypothetical protein [Pirellulaceae bacterium]MDP6720601.1 hypothetical protein [Pirellulaceae bacterium]MDP7017735.1 hypothetical protein [Pirellulaceae bacterium]HAY80143.1 hypothetical protein [Planctomycetaceae bacterium]